MVARGKTREEIAAYIQADDVIFQDLDDLKAACIEAAEGTTQIEDFEVGVFCGKYVTPVPEGYFGHLSDLRNGKRSQKNGLTVVKAEDDEGGALVASSGPADGPLVEGKNGSSRITNQTKAPEHREDIRYVIPLASESFGLAG